MRLLHLYSVVAGVYGPQSRSTFSFTKLNEALDRVISDLSAQSLVDCPGTNAPNFYEGTDSRPQNAG